MSASVPTLPIYCSALRVCPVRHVDSVSLTTFQTATDSEGQNSDSQIICLRARSRGTVSKTTAYQNGGMVEQTTVRLTFSLHQNMQRLQQSLHRYWIAQLELADGSHRTIGTLQTPCTLELSQSNSEYTLTLTTTKSLILG